MTFETSNTYILGRRNATEQIVGSKELWETRSKLFRVHFPPIVLSSKSNLMIMWLTENIDDGKYLYYEVFCEAWVYFVNEQDAIHFKLRWVDGN